MDVKLREANANDAATCGSICYEAFKAIADEHNFPPDFPDRETAVGLLAAMIENSGFYGVVAEAEGRIVGSNFLDERGSIMGIGPITVAPAVQNLAIGRRLMGAVLERAHRRGAAGIRLVQAGYHRRSLSLYLKLGFDVREHLSCMQGPAIKESVPGVTVRPANDSDQDACNRLCRRIHGHDRGGELRDAIRDGTARVAERAGRITGYTTQVAFFAHTVAETNDDLKALIGVSDRFAGPGFLAPSRNGELMRWCLSKGLRIVQPMTLMTIGLYNEPAGAWLPSVLY
jgi:predicted N-acetyltransferase YhbS